MALNGKKKRQRTINGATGEMEHTPNKKRDRTRLDTADDVLKEMRRLYRRAKAEGAEVNSLVWILGEIRKTMELTTLADQVEKLKAMYLRYGAPELISTSVGPQLTEKTESTSKELGPGEPASPEIL